MKNITLDIFVDSGKWVCQSKIVWREAKNNNTVFLWKTLSRTQLYCQHKYIYIFFTLPEWVYTTRNCLFPSCWLDLISARCEESPRFRKHAHHSGCTLQGRLTKLRWRQKIVASLKRKLKEKMIWTRKSMKWHQVWINWSTFTNSYDGFSK